MVTEDDKPSWMLQLVQMSDAELDDLHARSSRAWKWDAIRREQRRRVAQAEERAAARREGREERKIILDVHRNRIAFASLAVSSLALLIALIALVRSFFLMP